MSIVHYSKFQSTPARWAPPPAGDSAPIVCCGYAGTIPRWRGCPKGGGGLISIMNYQLFIT
jgi:hypothetical protein